MEVLFANCEFARWDEPNDSRAANLLSLSEGEGEGSFTTSSQLSGLNPSPQSFPLCHKGEAKRPGNRLPASHKKCSWSAALK
jgi:hypothetical protein